jgi:hypothetical protein
VAAESYNFKYKGQVENLTGIKQEPTSFLDSSSILPENPVNPTSIEATDELLAIYVDDYFRRLGINKRFT